MYSNGKRKVILVLIIFSAGFFLGSIKSRYSENANFVEEDIILRQTGYKFTNPLLECEANFRELGNISSIKEEVNDFISEQKEADNVNSVSVYFRDLNNGPWFGIGEKEPFSPASLLKVPVIISFLKKAETDPDLLNKKVTFIRSEDLNPNIEQVFKPAIVMADKQEYSIKELLERSGAYSDNEANNLLLKNSSLADFNKTFSDLGIKAPSNETGIKDNFMTVKEYATFFRILYNASYLNREMSETALAILSESNFKRGIEAGVDLGIEVSHKFGERAVTPFKKQLHDCGIVYLPQKPYLLCVMTRGGDYSKMADTIKEISKKIYVFLREQDR